MKRVPIYYVQLITILFSLQPTVERVIAYYDFQLGAPKCTKVGKACDTMNLINGRGTITNGAEPMLSSTLDSCVDGNSGSYHKDESIDRIVVRTSDGSDFHGGVEVVIDATVYAWNTGKADHAHFFYTTDPTNPNWILIGSKQPTTGGVTTISMSYTLPSGFPLQAIRVTYQYSSNGGSSDPCPGGDYDDADDVVFAVWTENPPTQLVSSMDNITFAVGKTVAYFSTCALKILHEAHNNSFSF